MGRWMRTRVLVAGLFLAVPLAASAEYIVINNGLDCSNPGNVIDQDTYQGDTLYVRNVGCPPGWPEVGNPFDDCPSPGDPTEVCVEVGGFVSYMHVYDFSTVTMNDGSVMELYSHRSSTVAVRGGWLWNLRGHDSSSVTMSGGDLQASIFGEDSSTVTIMGFGFAVDGDPVPYGDVAAQYGALTGMLASGEPLNGGFCQGGGVCTGTITLAFAPQVPSLSLWGCLAMVSCLLGFGLVQGRRLR